MDKIELKNALPEVFALRDDIRSEIWHREVTFERGHLYLVEAGSYRQIIPLQLYHRLS